MNAATTTMFTAGDVTRLTGLSGRQVRYWDRISFLPATMRTGDEAGHGSRRLWDFRAVVQLRAIRRLQQAGVSTFKIRAVFQFLRERFSEHPDLAGFVFIVNNRRDVAALAPGEQLPISTLFAPGQLLLQLPIAEVRREVEKAARDLQWVS